MDFASGAAGKGLKPVLARALNRNQLLILREIAKSTNLGVTKILLFLERKYSIPLSTLKLNAGILRKLNLVTFEESSPARLTDLGKLTLRILEDSQENNSK